MQTFFFVFLVLLFLFVVFILLLLPLDNVSVQLRHLGCSEQLMLIIQVGVYHLQYSLPQNLFSRHPDVIVVIPKVTDSEQKPTFPLHEQASVGGTGRLVHVKGVVRHIVVAVLGESRGVTFHGGRR